MTIEEARHELARWYCYPAVKAIESLIDAKLSEQAPDAKAEGGSHGIWAGPLCAACASGRTFEECTVGHLAPRPCIRCGEPTTNGCITNEALAALLPEWELERAESLLDMLDGVTDFRQRRISVAAFIASALRSKAVPPSRYDAMGATPRTSQGLGSQGEPSGGGKAGEARHSEGCPLRTGNYTVGNCTCSAYPAPADVKEPGGSGEDDETGAICAYNGSSFGTAYTNLHWSDLGRDIRSMFLKFFRFARDAGRRERDAEVTELRRQYEVMKSMHKNAMESVELCTNERQQADLKLENQTRATADAVRMYGEQRERAEKAEAKVAAALAELRAVQEAIKPDSVSTYEAGGMLSGAVDNVVEILEAERRGGEG